MSTTATSTSIGHYQLVERLGEGTFGVVWRAHHHRVAQIEVAVKVLRSELAADPDFVRGLERECALLHQLAHPRIVGFRDLVLTDGGAAVVLELLRGQDLHARIRRGALPPAEVSQHLDAILAGLAHAHAHGVLHRDIKPANVFLCRRGGIKLLDFGIARAAEGAHATRTGVIAGTYDYMAPEVFEGKLGAAADLYAAGLVAWEMLVGRAACPQGVPAAKMGWHLGVGPSDVRAEVPGCPPELAERIQRLTHRDPEVRRTAAAVESTSTGVEAPTDGPVDPNPATQRSASVQPDTVRSISTPVSVPDNAPSAPSAPQTVRSLAPSQPAPPAAEPATGTVRAVPLPAATDKAAAEEAPPEAPASPTSPTEPEAPAPPAPAPASPNTRLGSPMGLIAAGVLGLGVIGLLASWASGLGQIDPPESTAVASSEPAPVPLVEAPAPPSSTDLGNAALDAYQASMSAGDLDAAHAAVAEARGHFTDAGDTRAAADTAWIEIGSAFTLRFDGDLTAPLSCLSGPKAAFAASLTTWLQTGDPRDLPRVLPDSMAPLERVLWAFALGDLGGPVGSEDDPTHGAGWYALAASAADEDADAGLALAAEVARLRRLLALGADTSRTEAVLASLTARWTSLGSPAGLGTTLDGLRHHVTGQGVDPAAALEQPALYRRGGLDLGVVVDGSLGRSAATRTAAWSSVSTSSASAEVWRKLVLSVDEDTARASLRLGLDPLQSIPPERRSAFIGSLRQTRIAVVDHWLDKRADISDVLASHARAEVAAGLNTVTIPSLTELGANERWALLAWGAPSSTHRLAHTGADEVAVRKAPLSGFARLLDARTQGGSSGLRAGNTLRSALLDPFAEPLSGRGRYRVMATSDLARTWPSGWPEQPAGLRELGDIRSFSFVPAARLATESVAACTPNVQADRPVVVLAPEGQALLQGIELEAADTSPRSADWERLALGADVLVVSLSLSDGPLHLNRVARTSLCGSRVVVVDADGVDPHLVALQFFDAGAAEVAVVAGDLGGDKATSTWASGVVTSLGRDRSMDRAVSDGRQALLRADHDGAAPWVALAYQRDL